MHFRFALVGNPNCGKTTMFNDITGSTQYVGNWPGVTIEKKEGVARKFKEDIRIIDLPGIYSLSPYSMEEIVSRDYILDEKPDVIVNIVDATNIERNLYLTTQVIELGIPVVIALNMMDEVEAKGDQINVELMEELLSVPVICTAANKGRGVNDVIKKALEIAKNETSKVKELENVNYKIKIFDEKIEKCIAEVEKKLSSTLDEKAYSLRWAAIKLLEGDSKAIAKLNIPQALIEEVKPYREQLEKEYGNDVETIITDGRYKFISDVVKKTVKKKSKGIELTTSDKIDKIVTNRILAIPIFLLLMYVIFWFTFGPIGSFLADWVDVFINETVSGLVLSWLEAAGAAEWLIALIVNGIIGGMGSMLVFVPQIMILFLFISILEDSGYMARAAFIMDRLLRKFGLSGKAFIPMFLGFGCSTPAVMATRTLENEKDRRLTIMLIPYMSCGARLPVYALFAAAFFEKNQTNIIFSIYLLGIAAAIVSGIILKNTVFKGETAPFVMELPPYRVPTPKGIYIHMLDRAKGFIKKAGTVIFAAAVVIWFLQAFSFSLTMVEDPGDSILGQIGKVIAPVFAPLGFGDWKSSVALITGFVAKEVVVTTLGILHGVGEIGEEDAAQLIPILQSTFTPLSAYAFMAFTLLYVPCIAAFAAIRREMNSRKWTLFAVTYQILFAWLVAFIIYQGGRLLGLQ